MLAKLPIKKDHLLLGGIVLMLIISYQFAFKKTIEAWKLHHQLQQNAAQQNSLSYQPGYLERKSINLDRLLAKYRIDSTEFRNATVGKLSELAEASGCRITDIPVEDGEGHPAGYSMHKIVFEGSYPNLLRLMDKLEQAADVGMVRSLRWGKNGNIATQLQTNPALTVWVSALAK